MLINKHWSTTEKKIYFTSGIGGTFLSAVNGGACCALNLFLADVDDAGSWAAWNKRGRLERWRKIPLFSKN